MTQSTEMTLNAEKADSKNSHRTLEELLILEKNIAKALPILEARSQQLNKKLEVAQERLSFIVSELLIAKQLGGSIEEMKSSSCTPEEFVAKAIALLKREDNFQSGLN